MDKEPGGGAAREPAAHGAGGQRTGLERVQRRRAVAEAVLARGEETTTPAQCEFAVMMLHECECIVEAAAQELPDDDME